MPFRKKKLSELVCRDVPVPDVYANNLLMYDRAGATINIIRDHEVVQKDRVKLPDWTKGIVKCANPSCVSNAGEPVETKFHVERSDPLRLRCFYSVRIMEKPDILKQF